MDTSSLLFEVSGEVCYKLGGIHTVIASKIPYLKKDWGDRYFLLGAFIPSFNYDGTFRQIKEEEVSNGAVRQTLKILKTKGINAHAGFWLVEGEPLVILFDLFTMPAGSAAYRSAYLEEHCLTTPTGAGLADLYLAFGYCLELFFREMSVHPEISHNKIVVHFHEYMTTVALPGIRKMQLQTIFTIHATIEGRYLASFKRSFHHCPETEWKEITKRMPAYSRFCAAIERIAARECHILTAVSTMVARECSLFHQRAPDLTTPNGLNTESIRKHTGRQGQHAREYIGRIARDHFMGQRHPQKLRGNVFYFFSAGRYEYVNKGYNVIIPALARLNRWMAASGVESTVVMFFITDQPNPHGSRIVTFLRHAGKRLMHFFRQRGSVFLFKAPASARNCLLVKDLARHKLHNKTSDRVKVLYHPQFLSEQSPSLKIEYLDFVKGCHLGIFPSYYEPWGYTPQECICAGVPAITSNLTGIGKYLEDHGQMGGDRGVFVIDRTYSDGEEELYLILRNFVAGKSQTPTTPVDISLLLDWENLISCYYTAYAMATDMNVLKSIL